MPIAPRDVIPGSLYADGIVRAINGASVSTHFVGACGRVRTREERNRRGLRPSVGRSSRFTPIQDN